MPIALAGHVIPFKTFRLQLRFLLPLCATLVAAAWLAMPLMDQVTLRWFSRDLSSRGALVTNALSESVALALAQDRPQRLQALFARAIQDERLLAIGLCGDDGRLLQHTGAFPTSLGCADAAVLAAQAEPRMQLAGGMVHVGLYDVVAQKPRAPLPPANPAPGVVPDDAVPGLGLPAVASDAPDPASPPQRVARLVLLQDLSFIERRSQDTRRYLVGLIAALGLVIALITMVVAQVSWRGWVSGVRGILRGEGLVRPLQFASGLGAGPPPELEPFAADLRARLRDMEDEFRRSQGPPTDWTADRLRSLLATQLNGDQVIVVSNREPYIHSRSGAAGAVTVQRPASGLVTAVEPVMRACSGTWVAHGSGNADRDVVDAQDRVAVPPGHDDYWLRRVWMTEAEEQGYYYGFANEGMWPLCHVAHVRRGRRCGRTVAAGIARARCRV